MLLTRRSRQFTRPQLNLAAMIDVVFLVLIFFLCTSSFRAPDHHLAGELPGTAPAEAGEDLGPIRIRISGVAQGVLIECDGVPCVDYNDLLSKLTARRRIADLPVILQGQGDVPFESMAKVLNACHQADLKKAAFSLQDIHP